MSETQKSWHFPFLVFDKFLSNFFVLPTFAANELKIQGAKFKLIIISLKAGFQTSDDDDDDDGDDDNNDKDDDGWFHQK